MTNRINRMMALASVLVFTSVGGAIAAAGGDSYRAYLAGSPLPARFGLSVDTPSTDPIDPDDLNAYLAYALLHNQQLQAAYQEVAAVTATISQASSLPDLRLGVTEYLQSVETRVGPQERAYTLSQSFPWFGTLSAKGDVQRARAGVAEAAFASRALEVITRTRSAWYELAYLQQAVRITEQHLQLATQWERVARSRYASGDGSYADVIKSQVQLGVLTDQLIESQDQRYPLLADFNALLNRDATTPVNIPMEIISDAAALDPEAVRARMLTDNPRLVVWDNRALEAESGRRLAAKSGYPGFTLGLNYIQTGEAAMAGVADSGTDAVMASLAINLPLWRGKYRAASREADSRYRIAMSSRGEQANALTAELERAFFRYRNAARKIELYTSTLIPRGRQSLEAANSAYETGLGGFLDLIDAQRLLLEFELSKSRAEFDLKIHTAEIEALAAGPLTGRGN